MKRVTTYGLFTLLFIGLSFSQTSAQCRIEWWGAHNGTVSTSQTSMTQTAAEEAFDAIFNFYPDSWDDTCYETFEDYSVPPLFTYYESFSVCTDGTFEEFEYNTHDPACYFGCSYSGNWLVTCEPTYVSISSFSATPDNGAIIIVWSTASEIDNAGFNIYRAE